MIAFDRTILFLVSKIESVKYAEDYLKRREWQLKVTTNLKEALVFLLQQKPSYFFISVDLPNPKGMLLANLLKKNSNVVIMGEKQSSQTASLVQNHPVEYKMIPPITGPAVERIINKITRDLKKAEEELQENFKRGTLTQDQEYIIKIRSGQITGPEATLNNSQILSQLIDSMKEVDTPGPDPDLSSSFTPHQSFSLSEELANNLFSLALRKHYAKKNSDIDSAQLEEMSLEDLAAVLKNLKKEDLEDSVNSKDLSPEDFENLKDSLRRNFSSLRQNALRKRKLFGPAKIEYSPSSGAAMSASAARVDFTKNNMDTILSKGSAEAMETTIVRGPKAVSSPLRHPSKLSCIFVDSDLFFGYLLLAFAENRNMDEPLVTEIKKKIFAFLRQNGQTVSSEESCNISVQEVDFQEWALAHSDFLKKAYHDGQEVAIAFFPAQRKSKLELNDILNKYSLSIDELRGDLIVEFDLFIHLPANDRLLLYTPKGNAFYLNQKERLQEKGITSLYISKEASSDLTKYRTQNYLNDKIHEFKMAAKVAAQ